MAEVQQPVLLTRGSVLLSHSFDALSEKTTVQVLLRFTVRVPGIKQIILVTCELYLVTLLVPDDICVVTAVETWAGNLPIFTSELDITALFRLEASQVGFVQHLQMEGPPAATTGQ